MSSDAWRAADAYYLDECAHCGGRLGAKGEVSVERRQGRELRFCCASCSSRFEADRAGRMARIDAVMIADQTPYYPLQTSIVSGERLPRSPVAFIWGNRLFIVASAEERSAVLADPARHVALLNEAVLAAQRPNYPLPNRCPVQGDILPGDSPRDLVVANRMVRVCCGRCARVLREDPSQYLALVDFANHGTAR